MLSFKTTLQKQENFRLR